MACDVLKVAQYPLEGLHPKHWTAFAGADAPPLDFVFTLCDPTVGEPLPHWPGRPVTADWRYPDPEKLRGETWERRKDLPPCSPVLSGSLETPSMQLPFRSLDEISLRERLRELGQGVEAS